MWVRNRQVGTRRPCLVGSFAAADSCFDSNASDITRTNVNVGRDQSLKNCLRAARSLSWWLVSVTVIDRINYHLFQPLLYQVATAALSPADISAAIWHVLRRQRNAEVLLPQPAASDGPVGVAVPHLSARRAAHHRRGCGATRAAGIPTAHGRARRANATSRRDGRCVQGRLRADQHRMWERVSQGWANAPAVVLV
jgi:hypothetical protein